MSINPGFNNLSPQMTTILGLSVNAANQFLNPIDATATGCSWLINSSTITLGGAPSGTINIGDLVYSATAGIPTWSTVTAVTSTSVSIQCLGNSTTPTTAAGSAATVIFYAQIPVSQFASGFLQTFGTWVGGLVAYGSGDGINFSPVNVIDDSNNIIGILMGYKALAILCTTYTSGTINGTLMCSLNNISMAPSPQNPTPVTQAPKDPSQTLKFFTGVIATSTTVVTNSGALYTISAGKTFYLTDVVICNNSVNASQVSVNGSLTAGTLPLLIGHAINTSPLEALNIGSEPSLAGGNPLVVQAGVTAVITSVTYFVAGYEQ